MGGAICGSSPFIWAVEPAPERWCFGERKRRAGKHVLQAGWAHNTVPDDSVGYWEPVWTYECDGCGSDRRWMW